VQDAEKRIVLSGKTIKAEARNNKYETQERSKMKMKILVFLVILAFAACLSAKISSQSNVNAMDGGDGDYPLNSHIDVNEASGMVFTSEPNYVGTNAGFVCDNNQYERAYWKVGDSAVVDGPNDPNYEPQLRGDGSLVLVFRLPVKPGGQVVAQADLASYVGWITATEGVDLYGIRHVDACDVDNTEPNKVVKQSDYFVGSFGCDANATFIQKEYIQMPYPASRNTWHVAGYDNDTNGPGRLRCWLQKQYTDGAVGGDYVLLRLNISGYRPISPYHQVQVSSMWDNPDHKNDINDINDMNSIPVERLTKTFNSSPRLFIRFDTSAAACPSAGVYCCAALPGDVTGNCHVDTNDLAIIADSWLETINVDEANLISRHSFDGSGTAGWDNSVAGGFKAIPYDNNEPNISGRGSITTDANRGKVADIRNSTDWLYVGPDPHLDANHITTQLTAAAWVKSLVGASLHRIAGKGYSWSIDVNNSDRLYFTVRDANDPDPNHPPITLQGTTVISDGLWHHVAATCNLGSGAIKLYVDGLTDANVIHYHGPTSTIYQYGASASPYAIGGRIKCDDGNDANIPSRITQWASILHGYVDEVRIYNRELSAAEIAALASWGLPADVTNNGIVNLSDFAALAEDWLECALFPNPATECLK